MSQEFDKIFKLTSDEDDRGTFLLVTGMDLREEVSIRRLDRELVRARMHVDERFEVMDGEARGIYVFEATTRFRSEVYERCGRYGFEQVLEQWKPVYPYFVVYTESGFPLEDPGEVGGLFGLARMTIRPVVVRLWEREAAEILAAGRTALLPWVVLLNSTLAQQKEAARRLLATGNPELAGRMAALAGLRYGSGVRLIERMDEMLITEEILKESSFYQLALERGREEGEAKGELRGEREGEIKVLRRQLTRKFGPLPAEVNLRIEQADAETLARWCDQLLDAQSLDEALR